MRSRSTPAFDPDVDLGAAIRARIRPRFRLTAEEFAARVRAFLPAGPASPAETERRLDALFLDDLYLASACAGGDEQAWRECALRHFDFLRRFARDRLPETAAGDVFEQVVADLWVRGKIRRFGGRSSLRTWLAAVVVRAAKNELRARSRWVSLSRHGGAVLSGIGIDHGSAIDALDLEDALVRAVGRLSERDRTLLRLRYVRGLSLAQIARRLRVSVATASRRLERTHAAVRAGLGASPWFEHRLTPLARTLDLAAVLGAAPTRTRARSTSSA